MSLTPLLGQLIDALRVLPGVGQKTAQRMALHLLERNRDGGMHLAALLEQSMQDIGYCESCRSLSEAAVCRLCADTSRDDSLLCVVQGPMDVFALEQAGYRGRYFVLKGHLSPLDGMGPDAIGIPALLNKINNGSFAELILATNPTVEGEATAHYIAQSLLDSQLQVTRLGQGMPMGGELELADGGTLLHALAGRKSMR